MLGALAGLFFALRRATAAPQTAPAEVEPGHHRAPNQPHGIRLKPYALGFALLWTLIVAGLLWIAAQDARKAALELALAEARATYQKHLLLLEPEFMSAKLHAISNAITGAHTHSLGIKLSSLEDPADVLETKSVQAIKAGAREISSVEWPGGKGVLHYLGPITMEKQCLSCHGSQGYKSGDIGSLVSVSVPLAPYLAQSRANTLALSLKFATLYCLGLIGLGLASSKIGRQVARNEQMQAELRESEQSYRNQFANNSEAMLLIDPADGAILDANATAVNFYGYAREHLLALRITDLNSLPAAEVQQAMAAVRQGQGKRFTFQHRRADGDDHECP